jgi:Ser/Thr protein kinase RdoA (MazF antagonist)
MAARLVTEPNALLSIAGRFAIAGKPVRCDAHNGGHINDTWFVDTDCGERYVLQRINSIVFADPVGVAANTARVIATMQRAVPGLAPPFVRSNDGTASVTDASGTYRMLGFVEGRSLGGLESVAQASAAGVAFGRFQFALAQYDASEHVVPIPRFHELEWQLERFDRVLEKPVPARRTVAANDIDKAQRDRTRVTAESLGPRGMIHGDGKVTNLLFDAADQVRAVLDFDTVMVGALSWDFGDLVRSAAALGDEDDPGIGFSIERYRALAEGYVRGAGDLVDADLRAALGSVPAYMAYMLGLRFLIDYLGGDTYFRVSHPEHNLVRAHSQFRLFQLMVDARAELDRIAKKA